MKKTIRMAAAVVALCFALTASYGYCSELTDMTLSKRPIKVYLGEFTNASGQDQISADMFKKEVERALTERRSVSFAIVKSAPESDVQVSATIKSYQYLEADPVKPSLGMIMILDAVTIENYADLSAEFTVVNTATGGVAMKAELAGYAKRMMTPAESVPLVYDKLAKKFVADTFGKGE